MSFRGPDGDTYGVADEDGVVAASADFRHQWPTLLDAVASGRVDALGDDVRQNGAGAMPLDGLDLLPPIAGPGKIVCIGKNYRAHAAESGDVAAAHPSFFVRMADSVVAHGAPVMRPRLSEQFDFEGELAVIIGRPGRHIQAETALEHVLGYSCFMDGSVRDYQFGHSLAAGKNFHASGSFGPWIVTADEVPDPQALELRTFLSGREVQHGFTRDMIFDVASLISYISGIIPLKAGDVIATGTPEGVGFARKPPLWMKAGDVIEVEIGAVGRLRNPVADEGA